VTCLYKGPGKLSIRLGHVHTTPDIYVNEEFFQWIWKYLRPRVALPIHMATRRWFEKASLRLKSMHASHWLQSKWNPVFFAGHSYTNTINLPRYQISTVWKRDEKNSDRKTSYSCRRAATRTKTAKEGVFNAFVLVLQTKISNRSNWPTQCSFNSKHIKISNFLSTEIN